MKLRTVILTALLVSVAPHVLNAEEPGQQYRFVCYLKDIGHDPNPNDAVAIAANNRFFLISALFQRSKVASSSKTNLDVVKIFDPNNLLIEHSFSQGGIRDDGSFSLIFGDPNDSKNSVLWASKLKENKPGELTSYNGAVMSADKGNAMDHAFGGYCFVTLFAGGQAEFDKGNAKFSIVIQKQ